MASGMRVGWAAMGWVMSVGAAPGWAGTARYVMQPLEQISGRGGSWVMSISPEGVVGGGAFVGGRLVPVVWGLDGKATLMDVPLGLGGVPLLGGSNVSVMGPNGVIAGRALVTYDADQQGIVWENGRVRYLASGPGENVEIHSVNAHGQVAGTVMTSMGSVVRAAVWDGDRRIDFPADVWGDTSVAAAINDRGDLAVYGSFGAFYVHDGVTTKITGPGVGYADVADMNQSGVVVGSMYTADRVRHAYAWANGVSTDLGTINDFGGVAAVNDAGQVVGTMNGDPWGHATLWENGVAVDLNTVVDMPPGGRELVQAIDISATGVILVTDLGGSAYLLIPVPEPTVVAGVAVAGMIIAGMPRGSRRRTI